MSMLELDPADLDVEQREHLLLWGVVPRPVAMVSTRSRAGDVNLAPFSYFTAIGHDPMAVLFCCGRKPDHTEKDTCVNARPTAEGGTGEFTVNMLVEALAPVAGAAARTLPHGESEYEFAGVEPMLGVAVGTPRLRDSPLALECRTTAVVPMGSFFIVMGEVVHVTVDSAIVSTNDLQLDLDGADVVGRMGLRDFVRTSDRFVTRRPASDGSVSTLTARS